MRLTTLAPALSTALLAAALAGCSTSDAGTALASAASPEREAPPVTFTESEYGVSASPRLAFAGSAVPKGGGHLKIGKPYKVRGRWYTPKDEPGYDRTGRASWYGPNFHGRKTANGEVFDQNHLSAAHTTFPLPSYARVTNTQNGRSVVVRVNDRGPYSHKRIIDVSKRTAEVLKFKQAGTAELRVQYLGRAPLHGDDTAKLVASIRGPGEQPARAGMLATAASGLKRVALPGVKAKAAKPVEATSASRTAVRLPKADVGTAVKGSRLRSGL